MIIDHSVGAVYQHDSGYLTGLAGLIFSFAGVSAVAAVSPDGATKVVASFRIPSVVQDIKVGISVRSARVPKVVK